MESLYDLSLSQTLDNYGNLSDSSRDILLTIISQRTNIPESILYFILQSRIIYNNRQTRILDLMITNSYIKFTIKSYYVYNEISEEKDLSEIKLNFGYRTSTNKYELDIYKSNITIMSGVIPDDMNINYDDVESWNIQDEYDYTELNENEKISYLFKSINLIFYDLKYIIEILENISNNINYISNIILLQKNITDIFKQNDDRFNILINCRSRNMEFKYVSELKYNM